MAIFTSKIHLGIFQKFRGKPTTPSKKIHYILQFCGSHMSSFFFTPLFPFFPLFSVGGWRAAEGAKRKVERGAPGAGAGEGGRRGGRGGDDGKKVDGRPGEGRGRQRQGRAGGGPGKRNDADGRERGDGCPRGRRTRWLTTRWGRGGVAGERRKTAGRDDGRGGARRERRAGNNGARVARRGKRGGRGGNDDGGAGAGGRGGSEQRGTVFCGEGPFHRPSPISLLGNRGGPFSAAPSSFSLFDAQEGPFKGARPGRGSRARRPFSHWAPAFFSQRHEGERKGEELGKGGMAPFYPSLAREGNFSTF